MKLAKSTSALFLLLFFTLSQACAQTTVTGNIYTSTTWTTSGSPYTIAASIVVFEGAVLTINPGVVVKFNDGLSVDLRGVLYAVGLPEQHITFVSADSAPAANAYIGFVATGGSYTVSSQVTLGYCDVSNAANFLNLGSTMEGPFTIDHCNFSNNYYAIGSSPDAGNLNITASTFSNNHQGVVWTANGTVSIAYCTFADNYNGATAHIVTNSVFSGNTNTGVYAYTTLEHCEIYNNNIGAEWDGHASTTITNNYIHDNSVGVQLDRFWNQSGIVFLQNKICHNTLWNVQYDYINNADLSGNCWCSTDSSYIRSTLRDGYVNAAYGLITYDYDMACNAGVTGVNNIVHLADNAVKVFPDPFYDQATFVFNYVSGHAYQLAITDQLGRTVRVINQIREGTVTINRDGLSPGMYFYQLADGSQVVHTGKIVAR